MAFPTTGLLDSFTRADQNPVASGWAGPIFSGENQLKIVSNVLVPSSSGDGNSYWNTSVGPDVEAYCTLASTWATGSRVIFYFRSTVGASVSGYRVDFRNIAGDHLVYIDRVDAGSVTNLGGGPLDPLDTFASGDSFGIQMIGSRITAFRKPSGGVWTLLGGRTDTTYTGAGFMGLSLVTSGLAVDDVGGGTAVYTFNPPVVDDFSGGDDTDITGRVCVPGGYTWTAPRSSTHTAARIVSGVFAGDASDRDAVISSQTFGPNVQVAATIATFASPRLIYLQARQQQTTWPAASAGRSCYEVQISGTTGCVVRRTVLGTTTDLNAGGYAAAVTWASGYKFGLECIESGGSTTISVYYDSGSGWQLVDTPIVDSDGSRPTAAGYVSMELENTTSTLDDFRVQTVVAALAEKQSYYAFRRRATR